MKKSILVALVSFFFVVIGSSSGIACWSEKKVLHLEQYALDGARLFCMHQAKAKNIAYAEQLRYQEMAEMIVNGQVTYASTYNPRIWLHVNQVCTFIWRVSSSTRNSRGRPQQRPGRSKRSKRRLE